MRDPDDINPWLSMAIIATSFALALKIMLDN
jgi:hypothetical protein